MSPSRAPRNNRPFRPGVDDQRINPAFDRIQATFDSARQDDGRAHQKHIRYLHANRYYIRRKITAERYLQQVLIGIVTAINTTEKTCTMVIHGWDEPLDNIHYYPPTRTPTIGHHYAVHFEVSVPTRTIHEDTELKVEDRWIKILPGTRRWWYYLAWPEIIGGNTGATLYRVPWPPAPVGIGADDVELIRFSIIDMGGIDFGRREVYLVSNTGPINANRSLEFGHGGDTGFVPFLFPQNTHERAVYSRPGDDPSDTMLGAWSDVSPFKMWVSTDWENWTEIGESSSGVAIVPWSFNYGGNGGWTVQSGEQGGIFEIGDHVRVWLGHDTVDVDPTVFETHWSGTAYVYISINGGVPIEIVSPSAAFYFVNTNHHAIIPGPNGEVYLYGTWREDVDTGAGGDEAHAYDFHRVYKIGLMSGSIEQIPGISRVLAVSRDGMDAIFSKKVGPALSSVEYYYTTDGGDTIQLLPRPPHLDDSRWANSYDVTPLGSALYDLPDDAETDLEL